MYKMSHDFLDIQHGPYQCSNIHEYAQLLYKMSDFGPLSILEKCIANMLSFFITARAGVCLRGIGECVPEAHVAGDEIVTEGKEAQACQPVVQGYHHHVL